MAKRELTDWLEAYLRYAKDSEPPISYHTWTALSLIAGALQRKVYLRWGSEVIYPNMYVVLVGPSGRARKGTAMSIGKDIMRNVGIMLASDSITREALIQDMKQAVSTYVDGTTGETKWHCAITAFSPELSVFLGQRETRFLADLTDWYDCAESWEYRTKHGGTDEVQGVCFNLLGATAPDWLQSILPQEAIGGGFTSRVVFVVEENKGQTVAEPVMTDEHVRLRKALIKDLERIAVVSGQMKFTPDANQAYVDWYNDIEDKIDRGNPPIDDPRFSGFVDRLATHIKKLSMLLSASRSSDLKIEAEDFDRAVEIMDRTMPKMPKTFGGIGSSPYSEVTEKIITYIQRKGTIDRATLMKRFYRDVDIQTFNLIEQALEQMKIVSVVREPEKNNVWYTWKGRD